MSWDQLKAIADEARQAKRDAESTPPTACPIDGEPLDINSRGVRNCPLGNFRWDGGPNPNPPRA